MPGTIADPRVRHLRALKATNARHGNPVDDIDRELAAARIETYVRKVVAQAPAMTRAQRDKIAGLLRRKDDAKPDAAVTS
jgi:hypothetical protein